MGHYSKKLHALWFSVIFLIRTALLTTCATVQLSTILVTKWCKLTNSLAEEHSPYYVQIDLRTSDLKMSWDTRLLVYTATLLLLCLFIFSSNHCDALIKYNLNEHQHIFNSDDENVYRKRREVVITENNTSDNVAASDISANSLITLVHLNDSHEQLTGWDLYFIAPVD